MTYRIVGDNSSVTSVVAALVANCSIANSTNSIYAFTPSSSTNTSMWPLPEQVIQWYRGSSFALSLDGYNNTAALASNQPPSNSSTDYTRLIDTPLPDGLNTTFFNCVNYTIGESVPLIDGPTPLSVLDIIQIVIWSVQAVIVIGVVCRCLFLKFKSRCKTVDRPTTRNSSSEDLLADGLESGSAAPTPEGHEQRL